MNVSVTVLLWLSPLILINQTIPLSLFLGFFCLAKGKIQKVATAKTLLLLALMIVYISAQAIRRGAPEKDILFFVDLFATAGIGGVFLEECRKVRFIHILTILIGASLGFLFSELNANSLAIAILLGFYLSETTAKKSKIKPEIFGLTLGFILSVYTIFVGMVMKWLRWTPLQFISIFGAALAFIGFYSEYLPLLQKYISSALVRPDIWANTLTELWKTDTGGLLLGAPEYQNTFGNDSVRHFSNFEFLGNDPHNYFVYVLSQYGFIGLFLFTSIFLSVFRGRHALILSMPLFASMWFEAFNSLIYFGIFGFAMMAVKRQQI